MSAAAVRSPAEYTQHMETVFLPQMARVDALCALEEPDREPFVHKYAAKDIMLSLLSGLEAIAADEAADESVRREATLQIAVLCLRLGQNYYNTEENHNAEKFFSRCVELLEGAPGARALTLLNAYNQLGVLWCNRSDYALALGFLEKANALYADTRQRFDEVGITDVVRRSSAGPLVDLTLELFGEHVLLSMRVNKAHCRAFEEELACQPSDDQRSKSLMLEEWHTLTHFYLAQVYAFMEKPALSARYCQSTLQRQLRSGLNFNASEWSVNCIGLAKYLVEEHCWATAEHVLAAAERTLPPAASAPLWPNLHNICAKFAVARLRYARDCFLNGVPQTDASSPEDAQMFASLELDPPRLHRPVTDFGYAREIFMFGMRHLQAAKEYYVLDGFVTDHVALLQDESSLYRFLTHFEADAERKIKMMRKRIALFEPLLKQLNPSVYESMLRQMCFDLGEIYSDMMETRLDQQAASGESMVAKVNECALNGIKYLQIFLRSLQKEGKAPERVGEEVEEAYLMSMFHLGRLFSKLVPAQRTGELVYLKRALEYFDSVHKYCSRNEVDYFKDEASVCKQMAELLPIKIRSLEMALQAA